MDNKQAFVPQQQPVQVVAQPVQVVAQPMMIQQQQGPPPQQIVADGTVCHCFADTEVCCLSFWTCMVWPFATNRERAGVMACLPSAAIIGVAVAVNFFMGFLGAQKTLPYQECIAQYQQTQGPIMCAGDNPFGWQDDAACNPCFSDYEVVKSFQSTQYTIGFLISIYLCIICGNNRSKLQLALGMNDAGIINYLLYAPCLSMFFAPCAQCQEARAVKHRWLANGQQPLMNGVQMPAQPAAPGVYAQAPVV